MKRIQNVFKMISDKYATKGKHQNKNTQNNYKKENFDKKYQ